MRETENANYVAALDEMTKAIAALEKSPADLTAGLDLGQL